MFNNVFEVRRSVRFALNPLTINRKRNIAEIHEDGKLLKSFYTSYMDFTNLLLTSFGKKIEVTKIANQNNDNRNKPFGDLLKKAGVSLENNEKTLDIEQEYEIEWFQTIQFLYKGLEEVFTSDFIENRKNIKYDKNGKKKQKNYIIFGDLGDSNFVRKFFEDFFNEAKENLQKLEGYKNENLENKSRRSDILFLVQKIYSREHLGKLLVLFEKNYIQHKNNSSVIKKIKQSLLSLGKLGEKLLMELKSSQSYGAPLEHISLNYYSVNKTPKELTEDINKKLEQNNLNKKYLWTFNEEDDTENDKKSIISTFGFYKKGRIDNNLINTLKLLKDELEDKVDIEELKERAKLFKARQKTAFLQQLQNKVKYKDFQKPFEFEFMGGKEENFIITLFSGIGEEDYNKMLDLTKKIEQETNKEKRTELKMERGRFFQFSLKKFKNFSEGYKKIAQKYGRDSAEIKSLERQKIDATKMRGWGFLSKQDDDYLISTFDIENSKGAFKEIKNIKEDGNDIQIFTLSSITLRALDKLCFKKDSTFIKKFETRAFNERVTYENGKSVWKLKSKNTLIEEGNILNFYIHILENQNTLNIKYRSGESLKVLKNSQSIEEFEINLKLETYQLIEKNISQKTYKNILENYNGNSYKITSYDLEKGLQTKNYTKWWLNFWETKNKEDKFIVRINPELTIFFREKDEFFEKENPHIKQNRRLQNTFILSTNFSFHSDKSYIDSAFIKEDRRKESIERFNEIYNNKKQLKYFYGLDKGINELITLGIFEKNGEKIKPVHISEKVPVYRITNKGLSHFEYIKNQAGKDILDEVGNKKKRYLAKNVSYFVKDLENTELFEKLEIMSCLGDLTYAKLIKGNIILNADIFTTLNLYKVTAKRFLNDAITKGNIISEKALYDEDDKILYYEYENKKEKYRKAIIYWKDEFDSLPFDVVNYKNIKKEIEAELNKHMRQIRLFLKDSKKHTDNEDISIKKVNNYKNAISANIVGIIMKLQEYFEGYICYETLDEGQIKKKGLSTFIGNVVNEKIYNRLQLDLDVPPILKKFRTDIGIKGCIQHGKVIYIDEKNTSSACPSCNEKLLKKDGEGNLTNKVDSEIHKLYGHLTEDENSMHHINDTDDENYKNGKWRSGIKNGKLCDYQIGSKDYPELLFIKTGDDLATYNIAKKAKEYLEYLRNSQ